MSLYKTREDFLEGQVLLIDKPLNWTSFQVVNSVRWAIRSKFKLKKIKVGHAGTLDPLATGLLILCTGKATRQIQELQGQPKEYTGTFTLGATTPSFDLETEIDHHYNVAHITQDSIIKATRHFLGDIQQAPPVYSALKKDGKRLYEYAREGKEVKIETRQVHISDFDITSISMPEVHFRVRCSKGTYIRSLAHDFGRLLESGAYLSALRRTKIGSFNVDNAVGPHEFRDQLASEDANL